MKYLSIGHEVIVSIPPNERKTNLVGKYDGMIMKIADRRTFPRSDKTYYELVGAVSDYGVPYGFIREWLSPVKGWNNERNGSKNDD